MKVLVIGSKGQVGSELRLALPRCTSGEGERLEITFADRNDLDLTDTKAIPSFLSQVAPDFLINASAYTAVDRAESEPELANLINAVAVREMAQFCTVSGCHLVHLSTDYVFDGTRRHPYVESDPVGPTGVYGRTKLAGENAIREVLSQYVVLRTSWVFGISGSNFVKTMLALAEQKNELRVVADQFGAPTSARAIAETIAKIVLYLENSDGPTDCWGTYHFSGYPFVSWAEFAIEIFEQASSRGLLRAAPKVNSIVTADYPTRAARPAHSKLDCSKLKSTFGIEPDDWKRSLGLMLDEVREGMQN